MSEQLGAYCSTVWLTLYYNTAISTQFSCTTASYSSVLEVSSHFNSVVKSHPHWRGSLHFVDFDASTVPKSKFDDSSTVQYNTSVDGTLSITVKCCKHKLVMAIVVKITPAWKNPTTTAWTVTGFSVLSANFIYFHWMTAMLGSATRQHWAT